MELIIHRINKIKDLKKIPTIYGTEIDIRAFGSKLILNHEAKKKVIISKTIWKIIKMEL